jgi:hypothetical protein
MSPGKKWRDRRRVVENHFRPASVQAYQSIQQDLATIAVKRLFKEPGRFVKHIREQVAKSDLISFALTSFFSYAGATILSIVYGHDVQEEHDPFVDLAEEMNTIFAHTMLPGQLIVNTLPFCASGAGPATFRFTVDPTMTFLVQWAGFLRGCWAASSLGL